MKLDSGGDKPRTDLAAEAPFITAAAHPANADPNLEGTTGPRSGATAERRKLSDLTDLREALLGFVVYGPLLLAMATVVVRACLPGNLYGAGTLYGEPKDIAVHLAASWLANALVGGAVLFAARPAWRFSRRLYRRSEAHRRMGSIAVGLAGGLALREIVFGPSIYGSSTKMWLLLAALGAIGALLLEVTLRFLRMYLSAGASAALLAIAAVALHTECLFHYVRLYGNLHFVLTFALAGVAGLAGATFASRPSAARRSIGRACAGTLALAGLLLLSSPPSLAARNAVLQFGGAEKLVLEHILWPLADRDGDGSARHFWGMDEDDHNPSINPLSSGGGKLPVSPSPHPALPPPSRSLVWVLVDTARADVFEEALELDRGTGDAFAGFASFVNYTSCGSRTDNVLGELLGDRGCQPTEAPAGLHAKAVDFGYQDVHFGPITQAGPPFRDTRLGRDDLVSLDDAASFIHANDGANHPLFVFVHLIGGHGPYAGSSKTDRATYSAGLRGKLARVAAFVADLPPSWVAVVMGDHGEELDDHGVVGHSLTLYEEVLRTPFLIRAPSVRSGVRIEQIGCPEAEQAILDAISDLSAHAPMTPVENFAALDVRRGTLGMLRDLHIRSLTEGAQKTIWNPLNGTWELYDLSVDRTERVNLLVKHPELKADRERAMRRASDACVHDLASFATTVGGP